ncbi:MAG: hypothetical protein WAS36_01105 [Candidatus Saccharimonadales bacterium]
MTKQPSIKQTTQKISRAQISLAAIGSVIFAVILYAIIVAAFGALENSNLGEGLQALIFIGLLLAMVLGPSIVVAVIVVPILKRNNKQ